jgi:hypothetical protein
MAYKHAIFALSILIPATPLGAQMDQGPGEGAPAAGPDARYCLRVDPVTGSRIETIRCETREGWAQLDVDLDKEWPTEGVKVIDA